MISQPDTVVDIHQACLQKLHHHDCLKNGVEADILRIDKVHPVISGNKWFKLKYHFRELEKENKKGILTFGGAWSNHIHAVAHICKDMKLNSVGIIRGERPAKLSHTLLEAEQAGMQLVFISRKAFLDLPGIYEHFRKKFEQLQFVPEGGADDKGILGAGEITELININHYSHVVTTAGTGTMSAGILKRLSASQQLLVISVLKFADEVNNSLSAILKAQHAAGGYCILFDYHFGGYAKYNDKLISFMNEIYVQHQIPTDIVYTAKMFFGFIDLVKKNYFKMGDKVLLIHSGGLQGNRSIDEGRLHF